MLTVTGCMNLTTRLQADDVTVKDSNQGEDCVPIVLGIGIGTAMVEDAMMKARNLEEVQAQKSRITFMSRANSEDSASTDDGLSISNVSAV